MNQIRAIEKAIAANVMARRHMFEGLTPLEIHEYQAQFAAEQLIREQQERDAARAAHEAEREAKMASEAEKRGREREGSGPTAIHYEDGPGGPLRLSFTILAF